MDNNSILTFLLVFGSVGTLYFLGVGAKAVFKLIGWMLQVLVTALLVGFIFAFLSKKVDVIDEHMQEDEQQPYLSDQEHPAYSEKDYEEYIDFPQSMLEPKYSSYQTV